MRAARANEERAKQIIYQYGGKDFSLADATSFVIMERQGIAQLVNPAGFWATLHAILNALSAHESATHPLDLQPRSANLLQEVPPQSTAPMIASTASSHRFHRTGRKVRANLHRMFSQSCPE